jgi:hypothetical protein
MCSPHQPALSPACPRLHSTTSLRMAAQGAAGLILCRCRQFIGGTQESLQLASSVVEHPEDASLDLEPVMVPEEETDAKVQAILDKEVGVGKRRDWDNALITK